MNRLGTAPARAGARPAAGAAALAVGAGVALQFLRGRGRQFGDIAALYESRGIRPHSFPYLDRPLEYPVAIGDLMWATSWIGRTATQFLLVNAVVLGAAAVLTTWLLGTRWPDARPLRFVAAPTLVLYAAHNWDLLPVAGVVVGLVLLDRNKPAASGLAFGAATWTKLYPALIVAGLAAVAWRRGDRQQAGALLGGAAVVSLVLNGPVLLASFDGWWHMVDFQGARHATWGSLWYYVLRLPGLDDTASAANRLSAAVLVAATILVVRAATQRRTSAVGLATALTAVFLLTNKVYSPQYSLWLLPAFAMVPTLSRRLWLAFLAADAAMYLLVFAPYAHGDRLGDDVLVPAIGTVVFVRAALLGRILQRSLAHHSATVKAPSPVGSSSA